MLSERTKTKVPINSEINVQMEKKQAAISSFLFLLYCAIKIGYKDKIKVVGITHHDELILRAAE
ncbi:hypothetical protein CGI69_22575 [Vibrio parahaemolyticus]|nr:hypothetical protein CGI69_22575 [Vibrio parahaemolyticus]